MNENEKKALEIIACKIRIGIIESTYCAKAGHPGGSLSAADYFAYLYFKQLKGLDPKNPKAPERDRFVLSKGHCAPGLYSALALKGFFPFEDLSTLRHIDSYLQGHPNMNTVPGIDMSTGSLGQGISTAAGMAKGAKYLGRNINVYTLLGDGEIEEGQVWEAMMFASQNKLSNFCMAIDWNGLQIDGTCSEVMSAEPIDEKVKAFGFDCIVIDGNNFDELEKAFNEFEKSDKPFAIIMKTVKGKGVSYMENQVGWHGKAPNTEEYNLAMQELNAKLAELEA